MKPILTTRLHLVELFYLVWEKYGCKKYWTSKVDQLCKLQQDRKTWLEKYCMSKLDQQQGLTKKNHIKSILEAVMLSY